MRKNFLKFITNASKILEKIHMIVLCETNITDDENPFYSINGFNAIFKNRDSKGGGIAVYIKESFYFKNKHLFMNSEEIIGFEISNSTDIIATILAIYRPPNQNISEFFNELDRNISDIGKKNKVILLGDMNIDIIKKKCSDIKIFKHTFIKWV